MKILDKHTRKFDRLDNIPLSIGLQLNYLFRGLHKSFDESVRCGNAFVEFFEMVISEVDINGLENYCFMVAIPYKIEEIKSGEIEIFTTDIVREDYKYNRKVFFEHDFEFNGKEYTCLMY